MTPLALLVQSAGGVHIEGLKITQSLRYVKHRIYILHPFALIRTSLSLFDLHTHAKFLHKVTPIDLPAQSAVGVHVEGLEITQSLRYVKHRIYILHPFALMRTSLSLFDLHTHAKWGC